MFVAARNRFWFRADIYRTARDLAARERRWGAAADQALALHRSGQASPRDAELAQRILAHVPAHPLTRALARGH